MRYGYLGKSSYKNHQCLFVVIYYLVFIINILNVDILDLSSENKIKYSLI